MTDEDPLDPVMLATGDDDWIVEVLAETSSTNAVLVERAKAGAAEGLVIAAEKQTAARGRLDRSWSAPAYSSLTFSVLLRPQGLAPDRWTWLPLLTGLAVSSALRSLGYDAVVKWPNDVLLRLPAGPDVAAGADVADGAVGRVDRTDQTDQTEQTEQTDQVVERKVCGILVERVETAEGPAAVVGIGLNTSMSEADLPVETATSLLLAGGGPVDRTAVLIVVLRSLLAHYADWLAEPEQTASAYRQLSATLGRRVRAELPGGEEVNGTALAVDAAGCLVISPTDPTGRPTGEATVTVAAGDVVHLRAT